MIPNGPGILSFAIFTPVVLEVSKKLFFLAINGNYGKIFGKICLSRCFDELKLRIPVWVRLAYLGKLFKNPRCQAGWNKNVLFGFS